MRERERYNNLGENEGQMRESIKGSGRKWETGNTPIMKVTRRRENKHKSCNCHL